MKPAKGSDDAHLLVGKALGNTYRRLNRSENYQEVPPAFAVHDSDGAVWTLGFQYNPDCYGIPGKRDVLEFNVLRNDVDTGEFASRIVMEAGIATLYGRRGRRRFSRSRKAFI
jgi:hypothetical protein